MTAHVSHVRMAGKTSWVGLLLSLFILWGGLSTSNAALLDGIFSGFEETLAEGLKAKGETLTVGDFYSAERPDGHGPIGTMGNHTHNSGEWMFSYRYMNMFMGRSSEWCERGVKCLGPESGRIQFPCDLRHK